MEQERKEKYQKRILFENPYDIETILQSLSIASQNGREIIFMDRLISHIRLDPNIETTELSYNILRELELLTLEKTE